MPGHSSTTAVAITWAASWRISHSASSASSPSLVGVTIAIAAPSGSGAARSRSSPSTLTPSASFARRGPIAAAASAPLAPSGSQRRSVRKRYVMADIAGHASERHHKVRAGGNRRRQEVIFRNSKLVLVLVALAVAALAYPPCRRRQGTVEVQAKLKGNTEVPGPGSKKGKGDVHIELKAKKKKVSSSSRSPGSTSRRGHIHKGTADVAGDVVVLLFEDTAARGHGQLRGLHQGREEEADQEDRQEADRYYVNIHTWFPDGAIRGQLEPVK